MYAWEVREGARCRGKRKKPRRALRLRRKEGDIQGEMVSRRVGDTAAEEEGPRRARTGTAEWIAEGLREGGKEKVETAKWKENERGRREDGKGGTEDERADRTGRQKGRLRVGAGEIWTEPQREEQTEG